MSEPRTWFGAFGSNRRFDGIMDEPPPAPACPFGQDALAFNEQNPFRKAERRAVTALVAKCPEMAEVIERHWKEMRRLAGDLAHLGATPHLVFPRNQPADAPGRGTPGGESLLLVGECLRMVLDISPDDQGMAFRSRRIARAHAVEEGKRHRRSCL